MPLDVLLLKYAWPDQKRIKISIQYTQFCDFQ